MSIICTTALGEPFILALQKTFPHLAIFPGNVKDCLAPPEMVTRVIIMTSYVEESENILHEVAQSGFPVEKLLFLTHPNFPGKEELLMSSQNYGFGLTEANFIPFPTTAEALRELTPFF